MVSNLRSPHQAFAPQMPPQSHRTCSCPAVPAGERVSQRDCHPRSLLLRRGLAVSTLTALSWQLKESRTEAAASTPLSPLAVEEGKVAMRTLGGSELAIGFYPKFLYNAAGGGGVASASMSGASRLNLTFDPDGVDIPDVDGTSTSFLGAPLLPFLRISIQPTRLEGFIDLDTGLTELQFDATFLFNAGVVYKAPPLYVKTLLTTESVQSRHHRREGQRLNQNGLATLVGVADISKTGDPLLDSFLQLPTDVVALMASQFSVTI